MKEIAKNNTYSFIMTPVPIIKADSTQFLFEFVSKYLKRNNAPNNKKKATATSISGRVCLINAGETATRKLAISAILSDLKIFLTKTYIKTIRRLPNNTV